jgi:two-component system invasion response regulator UvrY
MLSILIADDHAVVREGLKQILAELEESVALTEASNGQEVLDKIHQSRFDIVLLDISMPGHSGLEILKQLKNEKPEISVLILSMYSEEQYAVRALKAGASGYLTKESAPQELIQAIQKIASGKKYITPSLAEKIAWDFDKNYEKPLHESLSDREFQVLRLLAQGKKIKEIGEDLFLSIKTVSTYRTRILEKMELNNNAELIHYAIRNNLID